MGGPLNELVQKMGPPLCSEPPVSCEFAGPIGVALDALLAVRNGFYDFASALHVFPSDPLVRTGSLQWWNEPKLWRHEYGTALDGALCFAENVFGFQFALTACGVHIFDPETANLSFLADDLEGWADSILTDARRLTGWPIAQAWQQSRGALPPGRRLRPAAPFFLGGTYDTVALTDVDAVETMRFLASIYSQTKDLPDGSRVQLRVDRQSAP